MKVQGIEIIHHGPESVEVRNQSFRWGQSLASVLWIVIAANLFTGTPGPGAVYRIVAGALVVGSLALLWRTVVGGVIRLDRTGGRLVDLWGARVIDRAEIQWFATQEWPRAGRREYLTIRMQGDEQVMARSIYSRKRRGATGPTAVRDAADQLNRVLWDLRAEDPPAEDPLADDPLAEDPPADDPPEVSPGETP